MNTSLCRDPLLGCSQLTESKPFIVDRIEVGLRSRVTLPLAVAERFREAVAIPPAQGQSRLSGAESGAESLAEGSLAALVLQALGRASVSGALNRTIRQLLDRDEIGNTLPDPPNSRLQNYRRRGQPRR
jgi:hypothetical protein